MQKKKKKGKGKKERREERKKKSWASTANMPASPFGGNQSPERESCCSIN